LKNTSPVISLTPLYLFCVRSDLCLLHTRNASFSTTQAPSPLRNLGALPMQMTLHFSATPSGPHRKRRTVVKLLIPLQSEGISVAAVAAFSLYSSLSSSKDHVICYIPPHSRPSGVCIIFDAFRKSFLTRSTCRPRPAAPSPYSDLLPLIWGPLPTMQSSPNQASQPSPLPPSVRPQRLIIIFTFQTS
jgi:hypothetical protein